MEIRTYDEVDPAEVLKLNLAALDFPFTPTLADNCRRYDPRYLPGLAFYAVEAGQVAGQAGLLITTVETTEGPMKFGAAWAVCTLPEFGRQGIARSLMQRAEAAARELGCRAITLGTNRTRVAHRLYRELGYVDFLPYRKAFAPALPPQPARDDLKVITLPESALPEAEATFVANTGGKLGFVRRKPGFLTAAIRTDFDLRELHGIYRKGRLIGYMLAKVGGELLQIRSAVLPPDLAPPAVVEALRQLYQRPYAVVEALFLSEQVESLCEAGYTVRETFGTFMLKPLSPEADFRALLGQDKGRFYVDAFDLT